MKKLILSLGIGLALCGAVNADWNYPNDGGYDINLSVNGKPYLGKWTMVDGRPFVGVEGLSDALGMKRSHYYKAWNLDSSGTEAGDPLVLLTKANGGEVDTIRFGGVSMVDLYSVAGALDLPVHHQMRSKTIQIGSDYNGEMMKGKWYRYMARQRGWRMIDDLNREKELKKEQTRDREWDDTAPGQYRL